LRDYCVRCLKPTGFLAAFTFTVREKRIEDTERMPFAAVLKLKENCSVPLCNTEIYIHSQLCKLLGGEGVM
jgi:hypothetical protein